MIYIVFLAWELTFSQCNRWIRIFARPGSAYMVDSRHLEAIDRIRLQMFYCVQLGGGVGVDFLLQIIEVGFFIFRYGFPAVRKNDIVMNRGKVKVTTSKESWLSISLWRALVFWSGFLNWLLVSFSEISLHKSLPALLQCICRQV